jgi:16S rRNA (cytidine1402-2'-O)-methyltransferase
MTPTAPSREPSPGPNDRPPLPDFAKSGGLVPAIAQDWATGEVLMLAYMNEEAYLLTLETGYAHYFSRSRGKLWKKGETSGHLQEVVELRLDCDEDTVLLRIRQNGAACHTGNRSCFYRTVEGKALADSSDMKTAATEPVLYLIPVPLADEPIGAALPPAVFSAVRSTDFFIVENEKSAWRFLSRGRPRGSLGTVSLRILDEHTDPASVPSLFDDVPEGAPIAVLSEAGLPCVADPGALAVAEAHRRGIRVVPLVGPSSLMLALAASGMNGQNFAFRGYIPADKEGRRRAIAALEAESGRTGATMALIETPYRTDALTADLVSVLSPSTRLCVAASLLGPGERIRSAPVSEWRTSPETPFGKAPAVFLIQSGKGAGVGCGRPSSRQRNFPTEAQRTQRKNQKE